jgi:hypothetical protein
MIGGAIAHIGELPTPGPKSAESVLGVGKSGQFCGSGPRVASTTGKGTVVTMVLAGVEVGFVVAFILLLSPQANNRLITQNSRHNTIAFRIIFPPIVYNGPSFYFLAK